MKRSFIFSLVTASVIAGGMAIPSMPRAALAVPEPSRVPVSWELDFKYGNMERAYVTIDGKQQTYWFMRYTVTNNSGRDVLFTPNFELVADTGTALTAFKEADGKHNIPNTVYEKIKSAYKNTFLQSPNSIYGKLLQGEDNAKDGVIIFPELDPDARDFRLFVTGLSGETAEVKNPLTNAPVILQKSLEVDFKIPGQAVGITPQTKVTAVKWVMK